MGEELAREKAFSAAAHGKADQQVEEVVKQNVLLQVRPSDTLPYVAPV